MASEDKTEAFFKAAGSGDLPVVQALSLDPEVDLNWQSSDGSWTAFYCACAQGHVDVVRQLLSLDETQRPIDFNLADDTGRTPLSRACALGHPRVVEMLVADQRVDVNQANEGETTPLWYAARAGRVDIVNRILASDRQIDTLRRDQESEMTAAEVARNPEHDYMESEAASQRRREGCWLVASLLDAYEADPRKTQQRLRSELNEPVAGELFALLVLLSDGYLELA